MENQQQETKKEQKKRVPFLLRLMALLAFIGELGTVVGAAYEPLSAAWSLFKERTTPPPDPASEEKEGQPIQDVPYEEVSSKTGRV